MIPKHCVALLDIVIVLDTDSKLHISSTELNLKTWTTITLPHEFSSLTTYRSKFVLVGGRHRLTLEVTDKLWGSESGKNWKELVPTMPTCRYDTTSVSGGSPEILVVAGGRDSDAMELDVVEVLFDSHWITVDSLPESCDKILSSSTFHEGSFYFIGSSGMLWSLSITLSTSNDVKQSWSRATVPAGTCAIVSYSSRLTSIDEWLAIYSYSNITRCWLETSKMGFTATKRKVQLSATVMHTGQLLITTEDGLYEVTQYGKQFL